MKEIIFPRKRKFMWWLIAVAWTIIFLPVGIYMIVAPEIVFNFFLGLVLVLSSLFFLRIASYRYIVAVDDSCVYFYHKGLFHKKIPYSEVKSFSMNRFSPEVDLAITAGIVAGGHTKISEIYVHLNDNTILSVPSVLFTLTNRKELINKLEEKRKSIVNDNQYIS